MAWTTFTVLYAAALLGAAAIAPYSLRLIEQSGRSISISRRKLLLLTVAQNAVVFAVVIWLGLIASRAIGLGAPYVHAALGGPPAEYPLHKMIIWSVGLGVAGGALLLALDLPLLPRVPALLDLARKTSLWENASASFYGGVNEELVFRLLGLSGVAWLLSRLWHTPSGGPTGAVLWAANIIMAVLFGLGHLPATRAVAGSLTPLVVGRSLGLNAPISLICGWLFWQFGIEAAIGAHFSADIIYHVCGTLLLRANDRSGLLPWIPKPGPS